jgi:predicted DNA-binding protein (UPF0251 family)
VVRRRYFEDAQFEDIADDMGVSRERIRQIEAKALRKLKHPSRGLKNYIEVTKHDEEDRHSPEGGIPWRMNIRW